MTARSKQLKKQANKHIEQASIHLVIMAHMASELWLQPAELRRLQQLHFCADHREPLARQGVARPPGQEVATRVRFF